ncbi:MAG: DNA-binding protein [Thermoproteota archaeon]|nr:MAG: DNA-binding protein [Candidatus Korarchaeota archaeon]
MREENKKANIREEVQRAAQAMDAANLLFNNGFFNDAVSRLCYFLLYNIRALLLTKGLEPKSHEGALRLLGLHFIKEGLFEPRASHLFSKLMKYREEADYNPSYMFTKEDFVEFRKETEELSNEIKAYLQEKGYL